MTNIVELEVGRHFETDTDRGVIFKKITEEIIIDMTGLKYPDNYVSSDRFRGLEIEEIFVEYVEKSIEGRTYFTRIHDGDFFKFFRKGALYKKINNHRFLNVQSGKTFEKNKKGIDFEYANPVEVEVKKMKPGEVPVKFKEVGEGDVFSFHDNIFIRVEGDKIISPYRSFEASSNFNSETDVVKYDEVGLDRYEVEEKDVIDLDQGDIFSLKRSSGKLIKGGDKFYSFETGEEINLARIRPLVVDLIVDPDIIPLA